MYVTTYLWGKLHLEAACRQSGVHGEGVCMG